MNPFPLRTRVVLPALLVITLCGCATHPAFRATGSGPYVALAPMLGHVSSTNAHVWVHASGASRVSFLVGTNAALKDARAFDGPALGSNNAFMATTVLTGLEPSTRYHYAVLLDGRPALLPPYPAFTTAPREGSSGRVRIAFASCVGYHGYDASAGYADFARTNIDLLLMLGDNTYANTNDPATQRKFYFDQRQSAGWRGLSPGTPIYAIWDDHDYGPDNSDRNMKGKEKSLQTFKEVWANPSYGETNNPGIYFKFTRRDVDIFMLDVRYHRDANKATNLAHKTMLGAAQLAWLKRELAASRAKIKVLASGGEWQINGTDDSWRSFKAERDDIFKFIEDRHITGVLLISGDRHYTGAYHVNGKWVEVTTGPLGSESIVARNAPESFLNYSQTKGHFYCIYDLDTAADPPKVTLEVCRVGDGLVERRPVSWDEITGAKRITPLPPTPRPEPKPDPKKDAKPSPKPDAKDAPKS